MKKQIVSIFTLTLLTLSSSTQLNGMLRAGSRSIPALARMAQAQKSTALPSFFRHYSSDEEANSSVSKEPSARAFLCEKIHQNQFLSEKLQKKVAARKAKKPYYTVFGGVTFITGAILSHTGSDILDLSAALFVVTTLLVYSSALANLDQIEKYEQKHTQTQIETESFLKALNYDLPANAQITVREIVAIHEQERVEEN